MPSSGHLELLLEAGWPTDLLEGVCVYFTHGRGVARPASPPAFITAKLTDILTRRARREAAFKPLPLR